MCGWCGFIYKDPERLVELKVLKKMAQRITHRGPDDEGYFIERNVGLALRRLAIIDIAGGQQPVYNEDESIVTVYNGEIYNYLDLRAELRSKGHIFKTNCDTEVLVHLYEEYGPQMSEHLNGMFAFAIYDRKKKKMLLTRDRLGIKPLYYTFTKDWFLFGSEIKSFLEFEGFTPAIDFEALHHYLTFRFVPTPLTLFKGVKKLPPGFFLEYGPNQGEPESTSYWDLKFNSRTKRLSLDNATIEVRSLIKDAVRIRLMSEVPLGVMLSGGVDSSAIVSSMKSANQSNTSSFTITYEEEGAHNEGMFAKKTAEAFQTDHHEININLDSFIENLKSMVYFMEEPIADPAAIPIYDLCRFSKEYVTVLLAGVGGDELFAGYGVYKEAVYTSFLKFIPRPVWGKMIVPLYNMMPERIPGRNFARRVPRPVEDYFLGSSFIYGGFSEEEKANLYTADFAGQQANFNSHSVVKNTLLRIPEASTLHKMMYLDTKHWLADSHLIMMDKMSMAHSIEMRVPLLDYRLVELAAGLPDRYKLNLFQSKIIFKKAFKDLIPKQILDRPKRGFSTPINEWIRREKSEITEILFSSDSVGNEIFKRSEIDQLLYKHRQGREDYSASIYTLLILDAWHRTFLENQKKTP